jgi:alpha-tubulin suppressor-like RCC1 family protein
MRFLVGASLLVLGACTCLERLPSPGVAPAITGADAAVDVVQPDAALVVDGGDTGTVLSDVRSITAGADHVCAVLENGTMTCWGNGSYGSLGNDDDSTDGSLRAVDVRHLDGRVVAAGAGHGRTCAVTDRGALQCWGHNNDGEMDPSFGALGAGVHEPRSNRPIALRSLVSGVVEVGLGADHGCALFATGTVKCWGKNEDATLGNGTTKSSFEPVDVLQLRGVKHLAVGERVNCAILSGGTVTCWGQHQYGALGNGRSWVDDFGHPPLKPVQVRGVTDAVAISVGDSNPCVVHRTGAVSCWGANSHGAVGDGTKVEGLAPVPVKALSHDVVAVASGGDHVCALSKLGGVRCWGGNALGQVTGVPTEEDVLEPVDVTLAEEVTAIAAGGYFNCALLRSKTVQCWGFMGERIDDPAPRTPTFVRH